MTLDELKIKITADPSNLTKTLNDVKQQLKNIGTTKVDDPIKSLQAELKLAQNEVLKNQIEVDKLTADFKLATRNVKELSKQLKSIKIGKIDLETYGKDMELAKEMFGANFNYTPEFEYYEQIKQDIKAASEEADRLRKEIDNANIPLNEAQTKLKNIRMELNKSQASAKGFTSILSGISKQLNGTVAIFKRLILRRIFISILNQFEDMYNLLMQFDSNTGDKLGLNKITSDLNSQLKQISANLAVIAAQLLQVIGPILQQILTWVNSILKNLAGFIALLKGQSTVTVANSEYWTDYAKSLETANAAQKKLIGGFDELNRLDAKSSSTSINPSDMYTEEEINKTGSIITGIVAIGVGLAALIPTITKIIDWLKKLKDTFTGGGDAGNGLAGAATEATTAMELAFATAGAAAISAWESLGEKLRNSTATEIPKLELGINTQPALLTMAEFYTGWTEWISEMSTKYITVGINTTDVIVALQLLAVTFSQKIKGMSAEVTGFATNATNEVKTFATDARNEITTWASTTLNTINTWVSNTANRLATWKTNTLSNISTWGTQVIQSIVPGLNNTRQNITTWVSTTANSIYKWATNVSTNVKNATTNIANNIYTSLTNSISNITSFVNNTSKSWASWATNSAKSISSWATSVATSIANTLNNAWAKFKSFMQATGQAVSSWYNANSSVIKTSAVIAAGVTVAAIALAPYTGGASLAGLVALKDGGVIDSPTVAMMGEYAGAKNNPEIAAPQSVLNETIQDNNSALINAFAQMTKQIITAIEDNQMEVSIGDDVIAKSAKRGNNAYRKLTGVSLF